MYILFICIYCLNQTWAFDEVTKFKISLPLISFYLSKRNSLPRKKE